MDVEKLTECTKSAVVLHERGLSQITLSLCTQVSYHSKKDGCTAHLHIHAVPGSIQYIYLPHPLFSMFNGIPLEL